jgi:hypothetical protein
MNAYEFVIAIIVVTGIFSVIRLRMGGRRRGWHDSNGQAVDSGETARLRDEVKTLQERIKVLERITVEKENSLSREIESLRDR